MKLAPEKPGEVPNPPPSTSNPWEIKLLALLCLAVYGFCGYYLLHHLEFAVGDALARTANAKYMLDSRQPHFAALGFVWGPIPTVSQLPAVLVLNPFGRAVDALWVTTSLWGAGTVLVMARLGRDLGLGRLSVLLLVGAYALNPVVVYYAANGMSEGPFFFFTALTFLGLLRYLRNGDTAALTITGFGVAGCALVRYEAIPLIFLIVATVLLADIRRKGRKPALLSTTLVALPAIGCEALWFIYMRVIKGSFTAFITDAGGNTTGAGLPKLSAVPVDVNQKTGAVVHGPTSVNGTGLDALHYSAHFVVMFAPALVLLPLLLLPPFRRTLAGMCFLIFAAWEPLVNFYYIYHGNSAANPRYFVTVTASTAVGIIYLASRINWKYVRLPVHLALALSLVLGWATGYHAELDHNADHNESEWRAFQVLGGTVDPVDFRNLGGAKVAAAALDRALKPGDLVLADVRFNFLANLYARKTNQWIINNDRDFDSIIADPYRRQIRIDYLLSSGQAREGSQDYADYIHALDPAAWSTVPLPGGYVAYRRIPGVQGPTGSGIVPGGGETLPVTGQ